jgi:D-galactarolactone cycloisomerase
VLGLGRPALTLSVGEAVLELPNGIEGLANLHVAAGVGGPDLKHPYDRRGWTPQRGDFMLAEPLRIDGDGCLAVPDASGPGIVLDDGVLP